MRISDFLDEKAIICDLAASTKEAAIAEMVEALIASGSYSDPEKALGVLMEREKFGSTGIGEGVAIPHGKLADIQNVTSVFALSKNGVEFESMDGAPVHILFLLLAPEESAHLHLKALARISRLVKSRQFRDELLRLATPEEIFEKIVGEDEKY
ncbi:PTS sugar transporter subunit IIA [bacterium]|nr:MAG: PTS sugar transporter subunit IIA [bacterium]